MKDVFFNSRFCVGIVVVLTLTGGMRAVAGEDPEAAFLQPSESARPGVWWHWMGCNVTQEGITRDLEAFKSAGISGATIFGMADACTPWAAHIENSPTDGLLAFSDPWWKLVRHAAEEGLRLGVDIGLHNCPGYTSTGGPWITPELAMQQIFQSQTAVAGGTTFCGVLPKPAIDPRGDMLFPMVNKQTGALEKPVIEGRTSYWRDIAVLAVPAEGIIVKEQVLDLSARMGADGRLEWTAPAGQNWVVYRFGHTTMGALTQPNQWEVMGLECDKMSEKAVAFHLNHLLGALKKHLGPLVGTGLRHVLLDSYEAGTPSWTPLMPQEFAKRRGYDLKPFLPAFAGRVVANDGETQRFRSDFSRTIADLYRDVLFVTMAKMLADVNLRFVCEPYGGPFNTGEVAPHVHRVMTEFWSGDGFGNAPMNGIFNAGEGKRHNILEAEAFTGHPSRSQWTETPAWLKPIGDGAFCAGINRMILHSNPHQPWDDNIRPGMTMGQWGTHFGRTQTWWEPGKVWLTYLARCQALLQWGAPAEPAAGVEVAAGLQIRSRHRSDGAVHLFFLANIGQAVGTADCSFHVTGLQPELWDPVTGAMRPLTDFIVDGDETVITLEFAPTQSWFVVFRKPGDKPVSSMLNFPVRTPAVTVPGPWTVAFDPKWGGPVAPVAFGALEDWTLRPENNIRYYSGTAVYSTTFDAPQAAVDRNFLDLGTVCHLARVRLNGCDLGVVWCAPWGVNVPKGLLKRTGNTLEIEVTNVWANRLIGDEQESEDCPWKPGYRGGRYLARFPDWFVKGEKRPSAGRYTFTTWNYFDKKSKPVTSGLLGPVRLMTEKWTQADSSLTPKPRPVRLRTAAFTIAFEADIPAANRQLPITAVEEKGALEANGGGTNSDAIRNRTTKNGAGGAETLDDGKTFRGYGAGNSVTFRLDLAVRPQGYELEEVRTFAGHGDARASQAYTVFIATADAPAIFVRVATGTVNSNGGSTELRVPINAKGVAAVRLDFANGPIGFNVYREISLVTPPLQAAK